MPALLQRLELQSWFNSSLPIFNKSIQRSYNFNVMFLDSWFKKGETARRVGPMPLIQPWHVLSVSLPSYKFEKNNMVFGQVPVSFPVLNVEDAGNMMVGVTLEEDELGTIEFFISWCQRKIIDDQGYYVPPLENRIGHMIVEVTDAMGIPVVYYTFKDIYFLNASDVKYSYDTNDSITREVTFGVDRVETLFTKYSLLNAAQKLIVKPPSAVQQLQNGGSSMNTISAPMNSGLA